MENKHEQLRTAIQDLLIEFDYGPSKLKAIADGALYDQIKNYLFPSQ